MSKFIKPIVLTITLLLSIFSITGCETVDSMTHYHGHKLTATEKEALIEAIYDNYGLNETTMIDRYKELNSKYQKIKKNYKLGFIERNEELLDFNIKYEKEVAKLIIQDCFLYLKIKQNYDNYGIEEDILEDRDFGRYYTLSPKEIMLLKYKTTLVKFLIASGIVTQKESLTMSIEDLEKLTDELYLKNNFIFKELQYNKDLKKSVNKELGVFYRKEVSWGI